MATVPRRVFPTRVGVFLTSLLSPHLLAGLPHAGGGVSYVCFYKDDSRRSSPRGWGCFFDAVICAYVLYVFPTRVGVFLLILTQIEERAGLPHAGGGVSLNHAHSHRKHRSSPRGWGCFCTIPCLTILPAVFPTRVGVFPALRFACGCSSCLPHAGGGVSCRMGRR